MPVSLLEGKSLRRLVAPTVWILALLISGMAQAGPIISFKDDATVLPPPYSSGAPA